MNSAKQPLIFGLTFAVIVAAFLTIGLVIGALDSTTLQDVLVKSLAVIGVITLAFIIVSGLMGNDTKK